MIEFGEKLSLNFRDCLSVEGCDFGRGLGLADCGFGLFGEEGPVGFGVSVALGYGGFNRRGLSAASSFGFDAETRQLQFVSAQTTYNWDCCGMTLEYRRYAIANVRNENLFRFTFTLANLGSLGNLRRQERLY